MSSERSPFCSTPRFLTCGCEHGHLSSPPRRRRPSSNRAGPPTKAKVRTSGEHGFRKAGLRGPRAPGRRRSGACTGSSRARPPQRGGLWVWSLRTQTRPPVRKAGTRRGGSAGGRQSVGGVRAEARSAAAPATKARKSGSAERTAIDRAAEGEKRQRGPEGGGGA